MLNQKTKNPGIQAAIEVLREMSLSKTIRAEWEYHQKQWRDRQAREEFVYDQGKDDGINVGKLEGKIEDVNALRNKMNITIEEACDIIGISIEQYQQGIPTKK